MEKKYLPHAAPAPPPFLLCPTVLLLLLHQCFTYTPTDKIFIDCGSTGSSTTDRPWIGDDDPKYTPVDHQKSLTSTASSQPSGVSQVPYGTARLSRSNFSYSFPITPGPKYVRLHFFPIDYGQNFSRSDALFSVTSGPFTLLRNFSASLVADDRSSPSFFREFCVVVEDSQRLNLTFTPSSTDHNSNASYVLINGIEVVSMPPDLYYSNSTDGSRDLDFLGNINGNPYTLSYKDALETVNRINVGGSFIIPKDDTGMMFRSWIGPDDPYLTEDLISNLPVNLTFQLEFKDIPAYAAPENVYRTARSMVIAYDARENGYRTGRLPQTYNLTWSFQVDSNFNYLVRLHFCEFRNEIFERDDRVFEILIYSMVATLRADVIRWTGGRGSPTYRDYAVNMSAPVSKKVNLTVSLHPAPEQHSVYANAILNGVEVFKISSDEGNLAGPNPDRIQVFPPEYPSQPVRENSKLASKRIVTFAVGGGAFCILVLSLLYFLIFRRGRGADPSSSNEVRCSDTTVLSYSLPSDTCRPFSLIEIKTATNNFDKGSIIGVGGFGNVYRGCIGSGLVPVAIKRLNPGSQQGAREFMAEIEMLSQLRHLHLVSLIGCCQQGGEMILVYDYMPHGTLRDHLYNTENPPLPWKQRLEICLGAARGLQYLHMGTKHVIIHRDIKTTNILLDEKWVAKVSDFGLSKMRTSDTSKSYISTMVKGTFGYLDPDYFRFHRLTEKSDVYSFGVVLFEVLCARPPVNTNLETEEISLAVWVQSCYQRGSLDQIIDPKVKAEITPECLDKFTETAMSCLHDEGMRRPPMNDIVWSLELALRLQEGTQQEIAAPGTAFTMDRRLSEEDTGSLSDMGSDNGVLE